MSDVLAAAKPEDFRTPDPENTLYLELDSGRVVIELAPAFAPQHVANVKALVREGYFDGTAIVRVHENYVVQWADPDGKREIRSARRTLPAEFDRPATGLAFTALPERDTYANEVGFSDGFPVARESATGEAWLVHCYAMLGAGRDNPPDSGGGTELYVVIGHSPRHLDRNVTLLARVLSGMERLTALPRGTGALVSTNAPSSGCPSARCGSRPTCRRPNAASSRSCGPTARPSHPSSRHGATGERSGSHAPRATSRSATCHSLSDRNSRRASSAWCPKFGPMGHSALCSTSTLVETRRRLRVSGAASGPSQ
jgi:peptidylprolyl isomerase